MRKRFRSLGSSVFRIGLFGCTALCAAPVGNPAAPALLEQGLFIPDTAWYSVRLGFVEDWTFSQDYRSSSRQGIHSPSLRKQIQIFKAAWNIRERFDLSALLGFGTVHWKWKRFHGSSYPGFYWGGNGQLILFHIKNSVLGANVQGGGWSHIHGSFSSLYWQASIAFSQQFGWFCPYFGISLQQEKIEIRQQQAHSIHLTSRFREGPFGGFSLSNGSFLFLNCEGRGWIETALSLSCEIRF